MSSDPLDNLRSAWRNENAPLPHEALENVDPQTQDRIAGLKAVWDQQEVQGRVDLISLRKRFESAKRKTSKRIFLRPVALALLTTAAALLLWFALANPSTPLLNEPSSLAKLGVKEPGVPANTEEVAEPVINPIQSIPQDNVTYRDDGIELVSGSVRLVFIEPTTTQTH